MHSTAGDEQQDSREEIIILGGGIAGLSIGYHLLKSGFESFRVCESQGRVGGLARSFLWHDIDCDLAPHRLFSENEAVLNELLKLVECNKIPRQSKIVLNGKRIDDPINIIELLKVNFPFRSLKLILSYLRAKLTPDRELRNFDDFVRNSYGDGLNELFFKPYAEKLLGIQTHEIAAAWGTRKLRVSGLKDVIKKDTKLYFDYFYYPKDGGYGAFSHKLGEQISHKTTTQLTVEKIIYHESEKEYECFFRDRSGNRVTRKSPTLVSTLPLTKLLDCFGHSVKLTYRKMRLVYLHVNREKVMDQQWVYFIDQDTVINRVSEFKNFYPQHAQTKTTVLCVEITADPGCSSTEVVDELVRMNIVNAADILDIKIIDVPNAYPVFDRQYEENLARANKILDQYPKLTMLGRQAEFIHQDIDEIFASAKQAASRCMGDISPRASG